MINDILFIIPWVQKYCLLPLSELHGGLQLLLYSLFLKRMDYTIFLFYKKEVPIIVSEPLPLSGIWLLIAKSFFFSNFRTRPYGPCCSEKSFMGFQQFKEFSIECYHPRSHYMYETAEVLLLQGAIRTNNNIQYS